MSGTVSTEEASAEEQPPQRKRRRNPRVDVDFSVTVKGTDGEGEKFEAPGEAVKISPNGATLITDAPVSVGMLLRLDTPFHKDFVVEVNAVWQDETDRRQRCGVKLVNLGSWFVE